MLKRDISRFLSGILDVAEKYWEVSFFIVFFFSFFAPFFFSIAFFLHFFSLLLCAFALFFFPFFFFSSYNSPSQFFFFYEVSDNTICKPYILYLICLFVLVSIPVWHALVGVLPESHLRVSTRERTRQACQSPPYRTFIPPLLCFFTHTPK